ncbi:hypothetical protein Taro_038040 [Colocasia esculenta]|uniref:Coenzyme Q-binding protein COQ10 START domain-containing protein n=1 Tax=Colocasia esculenta TaxID=4460 RepID=A0A843WL15_COLES|nr:hypothetical protein [Colocasia esculenta]
MPTLLSALRAAGRLLSGRQHAGCRRNGLEYLWSCGEESTQIGRLAHPRCLGGLARIGVPTIGKLVNVDADVSLLRRNLRSAGQTRLFLGCGDGEEGNVLSKSHEERRVLGYTPEQLFAVVAAVDLYEDFVPWCQHSKIIRHNSDGSFDAELEIGFKYLVESYISHVELKKPRFIKTSVSQSGLFEYLINVWEFNPGPLPGTCDLHFLVDFKFQSPLYRQVASVFFKEVVSRLVSSFSDRCRRIYGPGVRVLENSYGQGA